MPRGSICISIRWVKDQRGKPLKDPRPLNESERLIIDAMLGAEFPGVVELRAQVDHVQVVGKCHCGCPAVDLLVPPEVPPSGVVTRGCLAPVVGQVLPVEYGDTREVIVHVDDGRLSRRAYVSNKRRPKTWPALDRLSVSATERPAGAPVECACPTCETGVLPVSRDLVGPGYIIDPIPTGSQAVCQPKIIVGRTLPNCGLRHRTVDGVGWIQVRESGHP